MNYKVFFIAIFFFISNAFSFDANLAKEANENYKNSRYKEAAEIYEKLLREEPSNPDLLYNAANSYYRLNENEKAMLYYLKAFKSNPRDEDIFNNMNYLARQNGLILFPNDVPLLIYKFYYFLSDLEIITIINISIWLILLSASFFMLGRYKELAVKVIFVFSLLAIFSGILYFMRRNTAFHNTALVTSPQAQIMSGPGDNFKLIANINSFKIVKILSETPDYSEIGLMNEGIKGWIKNSDISKI
jgi:tetratricopeptide (TPR) repeat protein